MPESPTLATRWLRSPKLIFLTFGLLFLTMVWTSPVFGPLYLFAYLLTTAFYLSFLAPNGKEWGDNRRELLFQADARGSSVHPEYVRHSHAYIENKRGGLNFTQQWAPAGSAQAHAVIFLLHGYADHTSGLKNTVAHWLVSEGFLVAGMDYPGHGRSDGLHVDIPSFDPILEDCMQFLRLVKAEHPALPVFLFAESMGGALAFLLSTQYETELAGAVFCAPMCQIAPEMTPPAAAIKFLLVLKKFFPRLPVTPTPDVADLTFKRPEIYAQVKTSVVYYARMPRLATAANMFFSSIAISKRLSDLRLPFLICHGDDDKVTDFRMSQRMVREASSTAKTLKLYKGAWHALLIGEEPETVAQVKRDIISWLGDRLQDIREATPAVNGNGKREK